MGLTYGGLRPGFKGRSGTNQESQRRERTPKRGLLSYKSFNLMLKTNTNLRSFSKFEDDGFVWTEGVQVLLKMS